MQVEVVYARPECQRLLTVELEAGATAIDAVRASGLLDEYPEIDSEKPRLGVFGLACDPVTVLRPGDRVELYRPLQIDPKEARRRRAQSRQAPASYPGSG